VVGLQTRSETRVAANHDRLNETPRFEKGVEMSKRAVASVVALVATVMVAAGAVSASPERGGFGQRSAQSLVGSWDVTVTLQNPPPGLPAVQKSLATFNRDGGTIESAAVPAALRGASHGAWERIARNLFAMTRVFFRFNPQTGAYIGTQKINATIRVSSDGDSFAAISVSELRDPAGTVVLAGLRATAVGTRIHVEQIPDQP
jgi:hypothetical protein